MFRFRNVKLSKRNRYDVMLNYRACRCRYFLPNQPQARLNKAVGTLAPGKRIFLMTSGNGAGKSSGVINLVINLVFGNQNIFQNIKDVQTGEVWSGFYDYPLFRKWPGGWPKEIWYVSNKDSLKKIWKEFKHWVPSAWYKTAKEGKSSIPVSRVEFINGWVLYFKTIDQDVAQFESADVGVMIFDEPPPRDIYVAAVSRLRKGGIILIPATPLTSAAWFVDDIIDKIGVDNDKWHDTVSVWENCIETAGEWDCGVLGVHPKGTLNQDDIEFTLRNYDPDEREARENGVFQHLSGMVYKSYYDPEVHFVNIKTPHEKDQYVYQFVLDPHDRRPPAAIWIRIDQWNRKRIIREWPSVDDTCYQGRMFKDIKNAHPYVIKDFVRMWIAIERGELKIPNNRIQAIIDPNFGRKPNSVSGLLLHEEYSKEFRLQGRPRGFITDAIDSLETGHAVVKRILRPTSDGDYPLQIDKSCRNCDYGMRHYSYEPEPTGRSAEKRDLAIRVRDLAKDFPDLIRYGCVVSCHWRPPTPLKQRDLGDYGDDEKGVKRGEGAAYV